MYDECMIFLRHISHFFWLIAFILSFTFLPIYQGEMVGVAIVFLILSGLVAAFVGIRKGFWVVSKDKTLFILALFWAVAFGSVFWSQIPWVSIVQFWVFSCLPLSVLFFIGDGEDYEVKKNFTTVVILIILSALSVAALIQYYMMPEMLYHGRVQWPLKNPNSLGAVFSLGAFLALGQWLKTSSKGSALSFVLILLGLVTTGSRGALGAFIVLFLIAMFMLRKEIGQFVSVRKMAVFSAVLIGLIALITFTGVRPDNMALVATANTVAGDHSLLWARGDIWSGTWKIIQDHMWLGTGIGTFPDFYAEHRSANDFTAGITAHNDPLQFWAEMGIASFVLFYMFVVAICLRTWKALRVVRDQKLRAEIVLSFCALGAMVMHAHVSFNLHIIPILFLSGFLIAVWSVATSCALGQEMHSRGIPKADTLSNARLIFSFINVSVLLSLIVLIPFVSNYHTKKAMQYSRLSNMDAFSMHVNYAKQASFGLNYLPYVLAAPVQISMLEYDLDILMREEKKQRVTQIEAMLVKAETLNPRAAGVFSDRAGLVRVLTDNELAYGDIDRNLELALKYNPKYLDARLWLVRRYSKREAFDKAIDVLNDGMSWCRRDKSSVKVCYNTMAQLHLQNGEMGAADLMLKKLKALD